MPANGNYRPIDFIIERLMRNSIIFKKAQLSEYDLAELIGEAILLIGAKPQYQDNFALVNIKDYRGILPCKPEVIETIRSVDTGSGARVSTDSFAGSPNDKSPAQQHTSRWMNMDEYVIKGNVIHVETMQEGQLEVKYQSLKTDDRGYPMIPDNERYAQAVESYVKYKAYRPMWEIGEIRDRVYQAAEQDWLFYVNSAKTAMLHPSLDEMESLKNMIVKLLPDNFNRKSDTHRSTGIQEQRRAHNSK